MSSYVGIDLVADYYIGRARKISGLSPDPSTKCGAVIVHPALGLIGEGFNRMPLGCNNGSAIWNDRAEKYERVVHAEMDALANTRNISPAGCTLYTWPPGPGPTCCRCAAHVIHAGIRRVVYCHSEEGGIAQRWRESCERGLRMYEEAGVGVEAVEILL